MKTMLLNDGKYHAVVKSYTITTDGTSFRKPNGLLRRLRITRGKVLWDIQTADYSAGYVVLGDRMVIPEVTREHFSFQDGRYLCDGIFTIIQVADKF